MKKWCLYFSLGGTLCFSSFTFASTVAKAIIVKGQVMAKDASGIKRVIKINDWLSEGETLQTAAQSFIKLLFKDQSQANLGAEGQIVLHEFPPQEAGILTLVKGKIRAQVTKEESLNGQDKLYIRTKSASMGIRGTDFQIVFNPENEMTSLVTFEGQVAMVQQDVSSFQESPIPRQIGEALQGKEAVQVNQGQFSGANPQQQMTSIPVKISPAQFETLKGNQNLETATVITSKDQKSFNSPIPPGISAKAILGESSLAKGDSKALPEGQYNEKTGSYTPPAGGLIDLKTGLYIPPPPGSTFDPITQVYIPPSSVGGFDPATGDYQAPKGLILNSQGNLVVHSNTENLPGGSKEMKNPSQLQAPQQMNVAVLNGAKFVPPNTPINSFPPPLPYADSNGKLLIDLEKRRDQNFDTYKNNTQVTNPTQTHVTFQIDVQ